MLCLALISVVAYGQRTVTGTVVDNFDEPVTGCNVVVKGTTRGVTTDIDGNYSISVSPNEVLVFSFIGYTSQEHTVGNKATINVRLEEDNQMLDDVVVVGYGVVKKSDLTSSISTIKGSEIVKSVTGNAMNALQGKVNGVQVASAGSPGAAPKILVRGVTTVNGSDPLYVVDGMPISGNINFLNNNDIESMEVLKDASAAAIYGTRGSNGVILITTKKGKAGTAKFNFSASVGLQTIEDPKMANAEEYEKVYKARYTNDGRESGFVSSTHDTDWWNEVVNKTALVHNYQLSANGGNDKFLYNISGGYFRQESQYDYGYYDKINIRINTEYTFNKYVKMGLDIAPKLESWDNTPNQMSGAMSMDPTTPVFKDKELWGDNMYSNYERSHNNECWNPVAAVARANDHARNYGVIVNPYLQIQPIKQLTLRTQFSANARFERSDSFTPQYTIDSAHEFNEFSDVSRTMNEWFDYNWTNTATYIDTFADVHNVTLMAGFTMERYSNFWVNGYRENTPNDSKPLQQVSAGQQNQQSSGNTSYNSLVSWLGRLMYNYDNRYYLTATIRTDGSSRFPDGSKYATFPSASAAWNFSREAFIKDHIDWLDNGKLRFGWGRVGNQQISNSATMTLMGAADYVLNGDRVLGTTVSSVGNTSLKWETVEDFNIGLDLSFLNSRLDVTADIFKKTSHDMLYERDNLLVLGYPSWNSRIWMNIGSMEAKGWEFSANWHDAVGDFTYSAGVNLSSVANKAKKFAGDGGYVYTGSNLGVDGSIIRNEEGARISRFYGYQTDGIFQNWEEVYAHTDEFGNRIQPSAQPGDIRFVDRNKDGKLNEEDRTYIGDPYPALMMCINLSLGWKNWDLAMNLYGTFGNDIFNLNKQRYSGLSGQNVFAGSYDKAWNGEGSTNEIPRLSVSDTNLNYQRVSDFFVEDGSYMRCKNLQIGYTLPKQGFFKDHNLRVYLSAQNLFTITNYSGMDPERPAYDGSVIETGIDRTAYPSPRTFLFGLDFNF